MDFLEGAKEEESLRVREARRRVGWMVLGRCSVQSWGGKRQRRAGGKNERPNPTPDGDEMIRQSWDPEGAGDEEDDDGEVKKKK
jgi:hypothetical protein